MVMLAPKKKYTSLFLRSIEKDLKDQFKSAAALRGDSMAAVIDALMREYVKDPSKFRVVRSGK
jgi:hypothetical protein